MAKGSLRVNGIIVDTDGEIKASTGDSIVIREDDGSAVITVDTNGKTFIGGPMDVGVDDTGHDVKFFGATSGKYMLWDESADSLIVSGTLTASGGTFSGDVSFGDNNKAQFGASNDLQIYHNGSYSAIVDDGTGNLVVAANDLQMTNADVSENYIRAYNNGRVELYYDNGEKLRTTSTGISVSGNVVIADGGNIGSASDTDAITIDSSGRVGIGTTSPLKFNTTGSAFATILNVYNTGTSSANRGEIQIGNAATADGIVTSSILFGSGASTTTSNHIASINALTDGDNTSLAQGELTFYTASSGSNSERMRIDSSGKVGIGTTSPVFFTQIVGAGTLGSGTIGGVLQLQDTAAYNATQYNGISFAGKYHSNGAVADLCSILGIKENGTDGNYASALTFHTRANGGNGTEHMRIDSAGRVGIGTTAPSDVLHIKKQVGGAYSGGLISGGLRIDTGLSGTDGTYAHNGITFYGDANNASFIYQIHNSNGSSQLAIGSNNTERLRIDNNGRIVTLTNPLIIGSTSVNSSYAASGSAISNALILERSTSAPDPTTVQAASNNTQAYLYCVQDGGVAKVFVMDSNGTYTQISTHTNDDEKDYEIYDSSIINGKKRYRRINVIKLTRALEKLTGEKFLKEWYD